jgi:HAD superfamily hydrolase (TIGR01509 family)
VLRAVLFDWGDTLMEWTPDAQLLTNGHRAGFAALGLDPIPAMTDRFRDVYLKEFFAPGVVEEVEYPSQVRRLLAEFDIEVDDDALATFLEAEHAAWGPARQLGGETHALLESLRERGLLLGLVSNAFDPPDLLHRDLAELGVTERLDVAVFSSEIGRRKPDPAIFEYALGAIGVAASAALFVGDNLANDIAGAAALGMRTCQAAWFQTDQSGAAEPDFQALAQMDVLTIAENLRAGSIPGRPGPNP